MRPAFPKWSPPELVKFRSFLEDEIAAQESLAEKEMSFSEEVDEVNTRRGQIRMIETLCTDTRMESVWGALRKRFNAPGLDYSRRLWQDIIFEHHIWNGKPKLTKAQSRALHRKIVKHASALV